MHRPPTGPGTCAAGYGARSSIAPGVAATRSSQPAMPGSPPCRSPPRGRRACRRRARSPRRCSARRRGTPSPRGRARAWRALPHRPRGGARTPRDALSSRPVSRQKRAVPTFGSSRFCSKNIHACTCARSIVVVRAGTACPPRGREGSRPTRGSRRRRPSRAAACARRGCGRGSRRSSTHRRRCRRERVRTAAPSCESSIRTLKQLAEAG